MIDYIALQNIGAYSDEVIHFSDGLTVLSGRSGAGKSTVLDAIGLCLFNSLSDTHANFIRHGAPFGNIVITLSGGFEVDRQIGKEACWYVVKNSSIAAEGVDEVSTWIKHHLGIPDEYSLEDIWQNIVHIRQFDIVAPFQATPSTRKTHFDSIFGLDLYEKTWQRMGSVEREIDKRKSRIEAELAEAERRGDRLAEIQTQIDNLAKLQGEAAKQVLSMDNPTKEYIEVLETDLWIAQEILRVESKKMTINHFDTCPTCGQEISKSRADSISFEIDEEIAARREQMMFPDRSVEQIKTYLLELREARASIKEIIIGMDYRKGEMERLARMRESVEGEGQLAEDLAIELAKVEAAQKRAGKLRAGFREVKPIIGEALLRAISRRANDMFREVWTDGSLEWISGYELSTTIHGSKLPLARRSGGQRVTAALATRLAMAQVVAQIGLLVVDEPTMGAVDGVTAEMLRPMFIRSGQTILVDHGGHFLDMAHRVIEIENEDGVSHVSEG